MLLEGENQQQHDHRFQNHEFRDTESRFAIMQVLELAEWLWNENLPAQGLIEFSHGCVRMRLAQELRHLVATGVVSTPKGFRDFEEVPILDVQDRTGHCSIDSLRWRV